LKNFLSFLGLSSIHYIYAEGLNIPDAKDNALNEARKEIEEAATA